MAAARKTSPFPNAPTIDQARRCRCGLKMHFGTFSGGGRWHVCARCDRPECLCPEHRS